MGSAIRALWVFTRTGYWMLVFCAAALFYGLLYVTLF